MVRVVSAGQSLGDRPSWGPHSSTTMADRPSRARVTSGIVGRPPGREGARVSYASPRSARGLHGSDGTSSSVWFPAIT